MREIEKVNKNKTKKQIRWYQRREKQLKEFTQK